MRSPAGVGTLRRYDAHVQKHRLVDLPAVRRVVPAARQSSTHSCATTDTTTFGLSTFHAKRLTSEHACSNHYLLVNREPSGENVGSLFRTLM